MGELPQISSEPVTGLLTDDHGKRSMMRLMSFISILAAIAIGLITVLADQNQGNDGGLITGSFLLAAFAPKALQKYIENSYPPQ